MYRTGHFVHLQHVVSPITFCILWKIFLAEAKNAKACVVSNVGAGVPWQIGSSVRFVPFGIYPISL